VSISGKPVFDARTGFPATAASPGHHRAPAGRRGVARGAGGAGARDAGGDAGELAASIAHEINQPLAGVVTNGQAVCGGSAVRCRTWRRRAPPWSASSGRESSRRGDRADSRAGAQSRAAEARLAINDVIAEVIALADSELRRHGVALHTDLAAALPLVLGDRIQLQQVLLNLLLNGMEALRGVTDRPRR